MSNKVKLIEDQVKAEMQEDNSLAKSAKEVYESQLDKLNTDLALSMSGQQDLQKKIDIIKGQIVKKDEIIQQFEKLYEKQKEDFLAERSIRDKKEKQLSIVQKQMELLKNEKTENQS